MRLCFFLSISVYSILTFIRISNHQKRLKDLLSYESNKLTLSWLKIISISFYAMYVVLFILGGITLFIKFLPFDPYYTVFVFIAIFSFVYGFYAVKQPVLVGVVIKKIANNENEAEDLETPIIIPGKGSERKKDKALNGRYSKSGLKADKAKKILDQLILYMEVKKPYLDRDLSIYQLSNLTGISRHHITEVLNELHGQNFFTFVNEYRVNEVIRRLNDPVNSNFTILAIAYDSGFNSKSTFNTIFKQLTGLTPSLYLAEIKKEN